MTISFIFSLFWKYLLVFSGLDEDVKKNDKILFLNNVFIYLCFYYCGRTHPLNFLYSDYIQKKLEKGIFECITHANNLYESKSIRLRQSENLFRLIRTALKHNSNNKAVSVTAEISVIVII